MSETSSAPPKSVGPYDLIDEIGRGAHGVVYRARRRGEPDRWLALKSVENRGDRDKLLLEPEILSRLHHPGIVGLEDYFVDGDELVVVLEYVAGGDLKTYLEERGPLSPAEVRTFLVQMAGALGHAHAAGVLHRDIKPSNILVERRGVQIRYVLTDFGIGRMSGGIQTVRHAGGTYHFMAPEQLRGRPEQQSDLWALGVVAYYLWTGRLPFGGRTVEELSQQVLHAVPIPPSQLVSQDTDEELEQIIYRLLEKSTAERTASAGALLRELGHSPGAAIAVAEPRSARPTTVGTYDRRVWRRIRGYWCGFALAALLSAGPLGLGPQVLLLIAGFGFYLAQRTCQPGRWWKTLLALALLATYQPAAYFWGRYAPSLLSQLPWVPSWLATVPALNDTLVLTLMTVVLQLALVPTAIYCFGRAQFLRRELALRRTISESAASPDECLVHIKAFVDSHPGDANFSQKYLDALLVRGRLRESVVEARLLLENDPYNFGTSLALAHAYLELGLYPQCAAICEGYLTVSGYCFEFVQLRDECSRV